MENKPGERLLGFARLNDQQLAELSALEKDLGAVIIALQPTVPFAKLTPAREAAFSNWSSDRASSQK